MGTQDHAAAIKNNWATEKRWQGIKRGYTADDVIRLRGSVEIKYTLGEMGARRLWDLLHSEHYVAALGAMTGCQAVQQVQAGLKSDLSEWLAGCGRCQPGWANVSGPEFISGEQRARRGAQDQSGAATRGSDLSG